MGTHIVGMNLGFLLTSLSISFSAKGGSLVLTQQTQSVSPILLILKL